MKRSSWDTPAISGIMCVKHSAQGLNKLEQLIPFHGSAHSIQTSSLQMTQGLSQFLACPPGPETWAWRDQLTVVTGSLKDTN